MTKQPEDKRIIHQGNCTVSVEKLPEYTDPVVIKKPSKQRPSRRILRSLENEYQMTCALEEIEGVRKALGRKSIENQQALILEYIDGETLRDHIMRIPLNLRAKLDLAVDLARILSHIHQLNVIHLDFNSKNILIGVDQEAVHIIDLGSASYIDRGGYQKVQPDQLLGTLPYVSPEQTGRINRTVDERSDLYSLGVVLYELMTLQLPFDSKDPLELIHDHIARVPVSPSEVSSGIPEVLSAIILKLLSKNTEDRYQSAAGVHADLEKCLERLSPEDTIEAFPLGKTDYAGRLRFPQKLYGRDRELRELVRAFESVCRDTAAIVFVGGYSGIGKTALVEEIQRPVSEKRGIFIQGKFDQLVTTPYAGITQALAQFASQILTQSETQLAACRSMILEAVGPNGRVLTDVVPSLELVIGPQPAVPDLSGQEAQNRFNYVFQRFLGAIAQNEHPLCLFLDDLQWVDPASLGLLKALFASPDLAHLLIVGAFRDNEVHEDHPLMTFIADLEKADVNLRRMTLQKLAEANIEALISDTLQSNQDETRELSRLIYSQAEGNPFFTRQVLCSLEDQGLLAVDAATGHWGWDMDVFRDLDVTASVVELLVGKLKELPSDIQETLKVAACIGNQFDMATLTVVTAGDDDAILDQIHVAGAAGLTWERDDRIFFVHDRVQEAAYALVPPEERNPTHLTIGRLLLQKHGASDGEQDLYRIVDQVNHGLHLIEDEQERVQFARLNLEASRSAGQANAFAASLAYARTGLEFLGDDAWERHFQLALALHEHAALMAFGAGDIAAMEHHGEQVLQVSKDPVELALVRKMRMEFLNNSGRFSEALALGLDSLLELGVDLPSDPDWELAKKRMAAFADRLEREAPDFTRIAQLGDQDPELSATFDYLTGLVSPAYIARPALLPLVVTLFLELCLEHHVLPVSFPAILSTFALFERPLLDRPVAAVEHCELALQLTSRRDMRGYQCRVLHVFGYFCLFWVRHLRETLDLFLTGVRAGRDSGDNEWAAYAAQDWPKHALYASVDLALVEKQSLELHAFTDAMHCKPQSMWINVMVTTAQVLRGSSSARPTVWRGTLFDDDRDLSIFHHTGNKIGLSFVHITKAHLATLFGDHAAAAEQTDLAEPSVPM